MATQTQKREAEKQKQQKMQLESTLAIVLLRLLNKMSKAAIKTFANIGQIIPLNTFSSQLATILNTNYNKTQKIFAKDQIAVLQKSLNNELTMDDKRQLSKILTTAALAKSVSQASRLLITMQDQLNDAFALSQSLFDDAGKIAKTAVSSWKQKTKARINPTIVNTEVQSTAEDTKDTTTMFVISASSLAAQTVVSRASKIWVTVGDDKVRLFHMEANGQIVPINQKYTVGGEKLAYPGDPAGSPGNIINCRCSSLTILTK